LLKSIFNLKPQKNAGDKLIYHRHFFAGHNYLFVFPVLLAQEFKRIIALWLSVGSY